MKLRFVDLLILVTYLATVVLVGFWMRKKARQNKESYLMGGKSLPWYMLGLSDASDMFDISGTMWMVSLCFVYGLKSIWIPWLWPVFNQVFMMMFLSKWLRRSNANTGAEWLGTRFGLAGPGVRGSHIIVITFALISCLGFLAYGFVGLGKFVEIFIPWDQIRDYVPFHVTEKYVPHFYGILFTLFAMFYSILGGMHSIVLGDVIKYSIMTLACFSIAVIAMQELNGRHLDVPEGWSSPFFGWELGLNWSRIVDDANKKIAKDGFGLFGLFFMMMLLKGIFASLAGPAPNYDMQKILSTRNPKDASKMNGFVSIILLPVRYSMITGLTVLGVLYYKQLNLQAPDGSTDFERILPATINNFLPAGVLGIVLTGLLGAFMGTFSGTLNAAQAYITNDIYLKYLNPAAKTKTLITLNYAVGVAVVAVGVCFGFLANDVNEILQWIVGGLYGGYVAANCLKWYWWRFNANGFFWGMLVGVVGALLMPHLVRWGIDHHYITQSLPLYWWPVLFLLSLGGCFAGTFTAPPTDEAVLKSFYRNVRPWGFWKPVHEKLLIDDPSFVGNTRFSLDMFNVLIGIIGQLCFTLLPMYLILKMQGPLWLTIGAIVVIVLILKRTWWNKLED